MDVNFNPLRIVRMQEVADKVALQPSTIYSMVQAGSFPSPFKIVPGGRAAGWLQGDIDNWLLARADKGDRHE
jgi:prophage regulatory protein